MSAEQTSIQRRGRAPLSPGLLQTLRDCADRLDASLSLRVGMMDSQSRVDAVFKAQREAIMEVAAVLRSLA